MATLNKKQSGLTMISVLFILGFIAVVVLLVLKITPIYLNHSKVKNAMTAVESMENLSSMSKNEIYRSFEKRFDLNYVDKVTKRDINVIKTEDYLKVEIAYERVEKIVGNLSVLVEFNEFFEVGSD